MSEYKKLELAIIQCLKINPELNDELIVEEKHFKNYFRLFKFMQAFYKKYKNYDFILMYSVCKDKKDLLHYIEVLTNFDDIVQISQFKNYQKRLIELSEETEKDKYTILKIYDLTNELIVRNITVDDFKKKLEEIYENANQI